MLKRLRNPGKEIRLLFLEPGGIDEQINLRLSTYRLRDAPDYFAISYMWGDEQEGKAVFINGAPQSVRWNCYYALWQARIHFPSSYIWIDSLCINQDDLDEKAQQVNLMGDIYRVAEMVLVCIGSGNKGIDCVHSAFTEAENMINELVEEVTEEEERGDFQEARDLVADFWETWIKDRPSNFIEHFHMGVQDFSTRQYWQRQWIIQEILQARQKVVLCGQLTIPWTMVQFIRLLVYTQSEAVDVQPRRWFLDIISDVRGGLRSLDMWLRTEYKCQDIHDRIFSGLSVVEWDPQLPNITADYRMSVIDLAKVASRHLSDWGAQPVLNALRLDMHSQEIKQLIRQRKDVAPSYGHVVGGSKTKKGNALQKRVRSKDTESSKTGGMVPRDLRKHQMSDGDCTRRLAMSYDRLEEDSTGRLTCRTLGYNPHTSSDETKTEQADLNLRTRLLERLTKVKSQRPIEVYSSGYRDSEPAAILCPEARVGDYITKLSKFDHMCLVLRHDANDETVFDIIGQGFMFWDYDIGSMSGFPGVGESLSHTFCTNLSDEDFLALSGQDLVRMTPLFEADEPEAYDCAARVERPFTRVSLNAKPQMWIVDDDVDSGSD